MNLIDIDGRIELMRWRRLCLCQLIALIVCGVVIVSQAIRLELSKREIVMRHVLDFSMLEKKTPRERALDSDVLRRAEWCENNNNAATAAGRK